jgi:4'-phosphopantetheinyl transferase EntD
MAGEAAFMAAASPARRAEFAAGRHCARAALARFGVPAGPVPIGSRRQPVWPSGFVGSITHCEGYAAAAVARRTTHRGVGIDAERIGAVTPDLYGDLFTGPERDGIARVQARLRPVVSAILFSAKEALYKAQFAPFGLPLDFQDCELRIRGRQILVIRPAGLQTVGGFAGSPGRVLTAFGFPVP